MGIGYVRWIRFVYVRVQFVFFVVTVPPYNPPLEVVWVSISFGCWLLFSLVRFRYFNSHTSTANSYSRLGYTYTIQCSYQCMSYIFRFILAWARNVATPSPTPYPLSMCPNNTVVCYVILPWYGKWMQCDVYNYMFCQFHVDHVGVGGSCNYPTWICV
jgi:hypothetical protein